MKNAIISKMQGNIFFPACNNLQIRNIFLDIVDNLYIFATRKIAVHSITK